MKDKLFKFKVSNIAFGCSMEGELQAIKNLIGNYEVVKKRTCLDGLHIKIWCKKIESKKRKDNK